MLLINTGAHVGALFAVSVPRAFLQQCTHYPDRRPVVFRGGAGARSWRPHPAWSLRSVNCSAAALRPVLVGQLAQRFGIEQMSAGCRSRWWASACCSAWRSKTARGRMPLILEETADVNNKVIISCAITGAMHTPTMSDALPDHARPDRRPIH